MKASEAKLLAFLEKSPQFIIPIYQRTYSWTEKECRQLWQDILRAGNDDSVRGHFLGSVVYIEEGLNQVSNRTPLLVIDGQQRLTTITLLLAALSEAVGDEEPIDGFSAEMIREYYLINRLQKAERYYKLLLTQTDRETLKAIVSGSPLPEQISLRVRENHAFFQDQVRKLSDISLLCKGLSKLMVVDIALTRGNDNPQLIFESMNSTGRELSQADLIRNFVLMGLEPDLQSQLYESYWRRMEMDFGQEAYSDHFDSFMRNYLTVKTGDIPRLDGVYEAFKSYARSPKMSGLGIEVLIQDIRIYANYYCAMALGAEADVDLARAFHDLRELKVDVAYPFLLELYADFSEYRLSKEDFLSAIRLIESYVFRRAICAIPTNSLNKTFATFAKSLKKDRYLESIQAHFLMLPSYRRFPNDEEFKREFQKRDLYHFRSRSYWLRRMENHGRKERVSVDEYTIEHIMPQNEVLSSVWKADLGEDWRHVHETYLHTLGNLTLTGYNSEYSDQPFLAKRDMSGGFRESPLRMNEGLGIIDAWNEAEIQARALRLAQKSPDVWCAPKLIPDVLDQYRSSERERAGYTIEDHPNLHSGQVRDLFDAFRREILALDECVTEEFLKLYVAYKAETNFVDVVPQAKGLRLTINMKFADITDPRGICKDTTHVGRWGNGDVETRVNALGELPYVVGLVRQSLEKQLGNGDE